MPFQIIRNDITKMEVDAIVNTASPHVEYGPGIDKAVYEVAGVKELLAKRREIGEIPRGESVITEGFNLPAKYIIHTVGIAWSGGNNNEEYVLRSCYKTVFQIATENNLESLAIPLLASGNYGFPKGIAIRIALSEIETFMVNSDMELYLVVFDDKAFSLSSELYGDIDSYISDNYVDEKTQEEFSLLLPHPMLLATIVQSRRKELMSLLKASMSCFRKEFRRQKVTLKSIFWIEKDSLHILLFSILQV